MLKKKKKKQEKKVFHIKADLQVCDFHRSESLEFLCFGGISRGGGRGYKTKLSRQKRNPDIYLSASKVYLLEPFILAGTRSAF